VRPAPLAEAAPAVPSFAGAPGVTYLVPMRTASSCSEAPAPRAASTDARVTRTASMVEGLKRGRRAPEPAPALAAAQSSLERRIRAHLERGSVRVTLTDNRYTMISVRRLPQGSSRERHYDVRLHHMFAEADPSVTRALARYIADNDRDASRALGEFIDSHQGEVKGRARRAPTQLVVTAGDHHDLRAIYDELNARYFEGKIEAVITWGPRIGQPRRRNSIKMGSYSVEDKLIRLHRSLDRAFVPRFFVEWIVFHEMLHQVHDIKVKNGRREFHSKEFLADEAMFEHYDEAKSWERRHLDAILTY
jgi:predicted metal-dependent hydrolase